MKYIDADKLLTEIQRRKKQDTTIRERSILIDIETAIASLQQDKDVLELCSQSWWEDRGWIMIPPNVTLEGIDVLLKQVKKKLQQEQSEVDLEKEIKNYLATKCAGDDEPSVSEIARHFAEWGAIHLNARKED